MLESLSVTQWLLATLIISVAFFVRGIAGFGSGLIAIPLLAQILPLSVVVPMVGLLDYIASSSHGVKHRQAISWGDVLPLLPFTLAGVLTALYLFKTLDADLLRTALGGFIVLYAFYTLLSSGPGFRGSRLWAAPAGAFGGVCVETVAYRRDAILASRFSAKSAERLGAMGLCARPRPGGAFRSSNS